MEHLIQIFEVAAIVVDVFGLALLILGFIRGVLGWLALEWKRMPWDERPVPLRKLRCVVGLHILFRVGADDCLRYYREFLGIGGIRGRKAVTSFQVRRFFALVQLAMIVAIRTVIEHFLSKEIEAVHQSKEVA